MGLQQSDFSTTTKGDGKAIFNDVIGGDMQIVTFAPGAHNDYQSMAVTVNQPTSVQVQLDKYIVLGPLLIPVSTIVAIVIIILAIILLAVVEIYDEKGVKALKGN